MDKTLKKFSWKCFVAFQKLTIFFEDANLYDIELLLS